ncbi:MAG: hypothetical protein EPO21_12290 [Chloroflexota bacterium]|nr:MAG: hypothetical protein EPO21_12290 [Chloroflexota bacterium]
MHPRGYPLSCAPREGLGTVSHPLHVAIVWHQHQPFYKNSVTGEHILPWVRLHGTKDYLHMLEILRDFPRVHVTVNMVPCLLEQLLDYTDNGARDHALELSAKPASYLTDKDKKFLLDHFFSIDWDNVIRRYPRYWQLLQLRNVAQGDVGVFSPGYWRDLQAWFNLVWIDPNWLERDGDLHRLVEKGHDYSQDEVRLILSKQMTILGQVVPTARELQEAGQVEISTTPYYHPILPLLTDTDAAREAAPWTTLPPVRFAHPEDAAEQMRLAVDYYKSLFGLTPRGIWPSEGAVSQEMLGTLPVHRGLMWLASDEDILAASRGVTIERDGYGHVRDTRLLYQPYWVHVGDGGEKRSQSRIAMIFRDHVLSDRIGFVYRHMNGREAAADLISRLHTIRERLGDDGNPYLVSIILDGENCWEGYEHNGDVFLRELYGRLSDEAGLRAVTVSEYLNRFRPRQSLPRLATGSWINRTLETWLGEPAQNQAWELLDRTRRRLVEWQEKNLLDDLSVLASAWREIYIAEGSDWFWWYCSNNISAQNDLFDGEFRGHLANVYRIIGLPVPAWLKKPIVTAAAQPHSRPPSGYVFPQLTGAELASPEWNAAGCAEAQLSTGSMQRSGILVRRLYYGFNQNDLYFRVETTQPPMDFFVGIYLSVSGAEPVNYRPRYSWNPENEPPVIAYSREVSVEPHTDYAVVSAADGREAWHPMARLASMVSGTRSLEISVPLSLLGVGPGGSITAVLVVGKDGLITEVVPPAENLTFSIAELAPTHS